MPPPESRSIERLREIVESVLGVPVPDPDVNIISLGANSMEIVRIINRVEDDLKFRPRFEDISGAPTISALAIALEASRAPLAAPQGVPAEPGVPAVAGAARSPVSPRGAVDAVREDIASECFPLSFGASPLDAGSSTRDFGPAPLAAARLGELLSVLCRPSATPGRHAAYASAGGRYAVQIYLQLRHGAVPGLPCGLYYHHPLQHELRLIAPDLAPDAAVHEPVVNAPIARRASFAVYLLSRPAAIEPLYAEKARDYMLVEAGAMAQLLRLQAPSCGIGLCGIGELDFEPVRAWADLDADQQCLYAMLGGPLSLGARL